MLGREQLDRLSCALIGVLSHEGKDVLGRALVDELSPSTSTC